MKISKILHTNSFDLQFDERDPERCKDLQLKPLFNITVLEVVWVLLTVLITVVSDLDEFELDDIEESVGETESSPDRPLAIVTQGMHQVKPKIINFSNTWIEKFVYAHFRDTTGSADSN